MQREQPIVAVDRGMPSCARVTKRPHGRDRLGAYVAGRNAARTSELVVPQREHLGGEHGAGPGDERLAGYEDALLGVGGWNVAALFTDASDSTRSDVGTNWTALQCFRSS